uniref:Uncharacterized protein n=1 Tax=Anopheles farauti TaxID=69004 RepID=A0A182QF71_9DIPT
MMMMHSKTIAPSILLLLLLLQFFDNHPQPGMAWPVAGMVAVWWFVFMFAIVQASIEDIKDDRRFISYNDGGVLVANKVSHCGSASRLAAMRRIKRDEDFFNLRQQQEEQEQEQDSTHLLVTANRFTDPNVTSFTRLLIDVSREQLIVGASTSSFRMPAGVLFSTAAAAAAATAAAAAAVVFANVGGWEKPPKWMLWGALHRDEQIAPTRLDRPWAPDTHWAGFSRGPRTFDTLPVVFFNDPPPSPVDYECVAGDPKLIVYDRSGLIIGPGMSRKSHRFRTHHRPVDLSIWIRKITTVNGGLCRFGSVISGGLGGAH